MRRILKIILFVFFILLFNTVLANGFEIFGDIYKGYKNYEIWTFWDYIIFFGFFIMLAFICFLEYLILFKSKFSRKILNKITRTDNFWNFTDMKQYAHKSFLRIQEAQVKRDINIVKDSLTLDLYKKIDEKLTLMKEKGEKDIIANITVNEIKIIGCEDYKDDSKDRYIAYIKGSFVNYTILESTNKIIKNKNKNKVTFSTTYHFIRNKNNWHLEKIDNSVSIWDVIRTKNFKEE